MKKGMVITLAKTTALPPTNAPGSFFGSVSETGSLKHFLYSQWLNFTQQPIPDLATIEAINSEKDEVVQKSLPPSAAAITTANHATLNNVVNSLTQFHYALYKGTKDTAELKKIKTADGKSFEDYANENSLTGLTGEQDRKST